MPDAAFIAPLAHFLANTINPTLTLLVAFAPVLENAQRRAAVEESTGASRRPYGLYILRAALSIGVAVGIAEAGKRAVVWPGHPNFPSGHESFAASAAACLVLRRPSWVRVALPLAIAMAWALVCAGFHDIPDVIGGLVVGTGVTFALTYLLRNRRA